MTSKAVGHPAVVACAWRACVWRAFARAGTPSATGSSSAPTAEATATTAAAPAGAASCSSACRCFPRGAGGPRRRMRRLPRPLRHRRPRPPHHLPLLRDAPRRRAHRRPRRPRRRRHHIPYGAGDRGRDRAQRRLHECTEDQLLDAPRRVGRRSGRSPSPPEADVPAAIELHEALEPLAPHLAPAGREAILLQGARIALADGPYQPAEREVLAAVGAALQIDARTSTGCWRRRVRRPEGGPNRGSRTGTSGRTGISGAVAQATGSAYRAVSFITNTRLPPPTSQRPFSWAGSPVTG